MRNLHKRHELIIMLLITIGLNGLSIYWFYYIEQLPIHKCIIVIIFIYLLIYIIIILFKTNRRQNNIVNLNINQNNNIEEVNNNFGIEIINTLENITINFINKECSICLEDIKKNDINLSCNHIFHKECLKEWFKIKTTCPICRKEYN